MTAALRDPQAHANRFGPQIRSDDVRFQLWAPKASEVAVLIDDTAPRALERDEFGFWQVITRCRVNARYRFLVDGMTVPDPASRSQPDDVDGPSQLIDLGKYEWVNATWRGRPWIEAVIYEAHVGLLGGFTALKSRLADLAELGVTALQLMPIGDFPGGRNWGYDGVFPFAPASAYGTPEELCALVDAAHGHGLMVFLDVVYNHFGPHGNYLPQYAAEFFNSDANTPWGAGIDFGKPPVRRFFLENALYWLDAFRFDGLRLDAVHAIHDRSWLVELAEEVRLRYRQRHVHLIMENEHNDAALLQSGFDAQWNDDFHNVMHVILTGERHSYYAGFAERPFEKLARCLAEGFIYQGETPPGASQARGQRSGHLPPTCFVNFLQNHDQTGNRAFGERLTQLAQPEALQAAMAMMLLSPQIPMLFMGEEIGATTPFLFFADFEGDLAIAVRDGRRREFAASPGFDDEQARMTIPDPNDIATFMASQWHVKSANAPNWRSLIRRLLAIRRTQILPHLDGASSLGASAIGDAAVRADWQLANGRILTLVTNMGDSQISVIMPQPTPDYGAISAADSIGPFSTLVWIKHANDSERLCPEAIL